MSKSTARAGRNSGLLLFFYGPGALALVLFLFSCSTSRSPVVYYVDQGKTQYFFPKTTWKSLETKNTLETDWLFRTYALPGEGGNRTILNYNLIPAPSKNPAARTSHPVSMLLTDRETDLSIEVVDHNLLFAGPDSVRYTSWLSSDNFHAFMHKVSNPEIQVIYSDGSKDRFYTTDKTFQEYVSYFKLVHPEN